MQYDCVEQLGKFRSFSRYFVYILWAKWVILFQAPVVQKLDSTIHRINHYPVDGY